MTTAGGWIRMAAAGGTGGSRYITAYDDDAWLAEQGIDIGPYLPVVERAWDDKVWACP